MSFNIEILEEKKNELINRRELELKIEHLGEGTPNRLEIKKKVAALEGASENLTIVREIKTNYGRNTDMGKVHIYENADDLKYYEPFHIKVRNLDPETRAEIYKLKRKREPYAHLFKYE